MTHMRYLGITLQKKGAFTVCMLILGVFWGFGCLCCDCVGDFGAFGGLEGYLVGFVWGEGVCYSYDCVFSGVDLV